MSDLQFTRKVAIKVDDIGDSNKPSYSVSLSLKKKINDISFTLSATEDTLYSPKEMTGLVILAEKDLGSTWRA